MLLLFVFVEIALCKNRDLEKNALKRNLFRHVGFGSITFTEALSTDVQGCLGGIVKLNYVVFMMFSLKIFEKKS